MKKALAIVLTLVLALGMMSVASAATGDGSVEFAKGDGPTIIPTDPPVVIGGTEITTSSIYFGNHDVPEVEETYDSEEKVAGDGLDKIGLAVKNADPDNVGWNIKAKIAGFYVGSVAPANLAIKNFTLVLTPNGSVALSNPTASSGAVLPITLNPASDGLGGDGALSAAKILTGSGVGYTGCNYTGELTVPAFGVDKTGDAKAVITWVIDTASI